MSKRHLIPSWNLSSGLLISHLASEKMTWMAGRKPEILLVKLVPSNQNQSPDKNEYLLMFPPGCKLNGGIGADNRLLYWARWGSREHIKPDEAGGLEVRRDGEWIPVIPTRGSLVVNVGDVFQYAYFRKRKTTSLGTASTSQRC
ncbi:hypothetical protein OIU74_023950 [Salix koriyanagi]|uniref:Isopenicillin N synthase-like Fe(2+) 2OG dioxygenase domain-containing protein n=1 Tax=Salix koriyanagi TaxID=2511006 RepID=A0A9Q1AB91_9ROSI|nr:hypothetical protein OIU74_023950 [Salix koriyanagi]